jgi:ferredoxin
MTTIRVNHETCQGYGNCVIAFPAAFDLGDDGLVVLKRDQAGDNEMEPLRKAAYDCPTESVTYDEST